MAENAGQSQAAMPAGESASVSTPARRGFLARSFHELGLESLYHSSMDVRILLLQRFVRLFAYGASTLVLVGYLNILGISRTQIGLFMTLTLAGDVCISFVLTLFADGFGRKATLLMGAALMAGSGFVFSLHSNFWALLAAAVVGVISPSGNEIGPFRAVEESVIAHLTTSSERSDVYTWYNLVGKAGTACGLIVCGWGLRSLEVDYHWAQVDAYRAVFVGYAVLGLVKFMLVMMLSSKVETATKLATKKDQTDETTPLLNDGAESESQAPTVVEQPKRKGIFALLPVISKESALVLFNISLLFALNALGSGLAPLSWITYFYQWRFHLGEDQLGTIFFAASIASTIAVLFGSSLARRVGNINAMVFTHIPSAFFLSLVGVPHNLYLSLGSFFIHFTTKSMGTGPKAAFVASMVQPEERTVVIGIVNIVKILAQTVGPFITGVLAEYGLIWVAFLAAGACKILHDIGILVLFKTAEKEKAAEERRREASNGSDPEAV